MESEIWKRIHGHVQAPSLLCTASPTSLHAFPFTICAATTYFIHDHCHTSSQHLLNLSDSPILASPQFHAEQHGAERVFHAGNRNALQVPCIGLALSIRLVIPLTRSCGTSTTLLGAATRYSDFDTPLPAAMSVWNPDNIKDVAESVGIQALSDNVVDELARDVDFRITQLLEEALKFMRHGKRTTLGTQDISNALRVLNVEPLYGYESTRPLRFGEASIGPGQPLYYVEDEEVDFEKMINSPLPKVPKEITFTGMSPFRRIRSPH
jgi:histone H3/H4